MNPGTDTPRAAARYRGAARFGAAVVLATLAYFLLQRLSFTLRFPPANLTSIWLSGALLLSVLLITPPRTWWAYLAGVPVAATAAYYNQTTLPLLVALMTVPTYWAGMAASAWAIRRVGDESIVGGFRSLAVLCVVGGVVVPAVVVAPLALAYVMLKRPDLPTMSRNLVLAIALGTWIATPAITRTLAQGRTWVGRATRLRCLEVACLAAGLVVVGRVSFGGLPGAPPFVLYAPLPLLVWAAVRFGLPGACWALLGIAVYSTYAAIHGRGPFTQLSPAENVLQLQIFLLAMSAPLMLLAGATEERWRAMRSLSASERDARSRYAQLSAIYRAAPVGLAFVDTDLRIVGVNDHLARMHERPGAEHLGKSVAEALPPALSDQFQQAYRRVIETGNPVLEHEISNEAEPSNGRSWLVSYDPVRDDAGAILGVSTVVQEITERKRAEEALRASEERYRAVVESQTEMVCRYRSDTTLTFVNEAYCRYFGRRREDLLGRSFLELIPGPGRAIAADNVRSLILKPEVRTVEHEVVSPDGQVAWQQWVNYPIANGSGEAEEFQAIGQDVTERRRAEEDLRRALAETERLRERLQAENVYLRTELQGPPAFERIIGVSETLKKVLGQAEQVAKTDATVLVLGETGTGKELLARGIHSLSRRKDGPLVTVNCAALPPNLIESELFGHEKGAFTGAASRRLGSFEMASGGTIFLDEIGELPLEMQVKLLRTLQEGEIQRVGGVKTIKVDVRIIAATNRDLVDEVGKRRFREDLYYRLHVFPITLPPLRDRRDDIPLLVASFVERFARRVGKEIDSVSQATMKALQSYAWPGNIRELQNVIERAVVLSPGKCINMPEELATIRGDTNGGPPREPVREANGQRDVPSVPDDDVTLAEVERRYILKVLERTRWRVNGPRGAATILGLNPNTLRGRMKKLGILKPGGDDELTSADDDPGAPASDSHHIS